MESKLNLSTVLPCCEASEVDVKRSQMGEGIDVLI